MCLPIMSSSKRVARIFHPLPPMALSSVGSRLHHLLFLSIFLIFTLNTISAFAQSCSAVNPCSTGCCSKYGFCGLGPEYCAPEVCVANCDRKSDCDPGGYGAQYVKHVTCPLNVCCSKWGYCGMTSEFCGDKKVKRPSCSGGDKFQRVVGYYEGWAVDRLCNRFIPEHIPTDVYSHLNFAFASIDPVTFEVIPASPKDLKLYKSLTNLKRSDPNLKVYIAIGGWTFNDPGPTATVFSDIARSIENQRKFFKSLISFMSAYNFDGVDIDWEYPVAEERSGRGEDFENFPKFMANLRTALNGAGGRNGISITLPASYWYLQHFDIKKLEKSVDFFNMMTYDFHGTWDKGNKWTGAFLNAHTNLTEITSAMDLLWRNDIDPQKVTLGLAFYGRAFTASTPNCLSPGCTFESGAFKQPCSNEISVMMNSEIDNVRITRKNAVVDFDKDAAVKILKFDIDQWVAYDDGDTFKMKADFARSQCMGGVMVWAVSQDTANAEYSLALAKVARKNTALRQSSDGLTKEVTINHQQCKWTNCRETCPHGWIPIIRDDGDAHSKAELMLDETGCGAGPVNKRNGFGFHVLCCPKPDEEKELPQCGWYRHKNGNCDPSCPEGYKEIGSNSMDCKNGKYQAACCKTNQKSVKLYDQCAWNAWPACDSGTCDSKTEEIATSTTGSGGSICANKKTWMPGEAANGTPRQERKFCCANDNPDWKWDECSWYDSLGFQPANTPKFFCSSGCPADTVRVAMEGRSLRCASGARAKCCKPVARTVTIEYSDDGKRYKDALENYFRSPYCPASLSIGLKKRFLDLRTKSNSPNIANRQAEPLPPNDWIVSVDLVQKLFFDKYPSSILIGIWDKADTKAVEPSFEEVKNWMEDHSQVTDEWGSDGAGQLLCSLPLINGEIAETEKIKCACTREDCCPEDDTVCYEASKTGDYESRKRWLLAQDGYDDDDSYSNKSAAELFHRADDRYFWEVDDPNVGAASGNFPVLEYGTMDTNFRPPHPIHSLYYGLLSENDDCLILNPGPHPLVRDNRHASNIEHIVERQTLPRFAEEAILGLQADSIRRRIPLRAGALPINFFTDTLLRNLAVVWPTVPDAAGGVNLAMMRSFNSRLMNALGTTQNDRNFVALQGIMNLIKAWIWGHHMYDEHELINRYSRIIERAMQANNSNAFLLIVRRIFGVFRYLNDGAVRTRHINILNGIRAELRLASQLHRQLHNTPVEAVAVWDEWYQSHLDAMVANTRDRLRYWINEAITNVWGPLGTHPNPDIEDWLILYRDIINREVTITRGLPGQS